MNGTYNVFVPFCEGTNGCNAPTNIYLVTLQVKAESGWTQWQAKCLATILLELSRGSMDYVHVYVVLSVELQYIMHKPWFILLWSQCLNTERQIKGLESGHFSQSLLTSQNMQNTDSMLNYTFIFSVYSHSVSTASGYKIWKCIKRTSLHR